MGQGETVEVTYLALQKLAEAAGIDVVGCTSAAPFTDLLPHLRRYYDEGRSSGFEHPVPEERIDPQRILPGAQSLIAIAVAYRTKAATEMKRPQGRRGMVSVYAWGEDYHRVLQRKLQALEDALRAAVGRPIRVENCIDTAPLVDRAVAERAGLGFIGKNCSLITADYGSWVFLGTLVTDVRIESSAQPVAVDECGDCDLCLTACPTGALQEPFVLHSSACLSYVTQQKGMIPEDYRAALGKRVWGRDTCQTVCPKNKVSLLGVEERFAPDPELSFPELQQILTQSNRAFMRLFGHTAAAWRGANVWRRNALIALGNLRYKEAVPLIVPYLVHERKELRGSAAWALRKIDPIGCRAVVLDAYRREQDEEVRSEMSWADSD